MVASGLTPCFHVLLVGCASVSAPDRHVGPVTSVVAHGRSVWSCSQAGVFTGVGAEQRPFCVPPFRATALTPLPDGGLIVGGGEPARSGEVARYDRGGNLVAKARVAEDLVYGLDCDGTSVAVACADGRVLLLALPLDSTRVVHTHAGPARAARIVRPGAGPASVASGGRDARILVTPVEGGPTLAVVDHTGGVECLDVAAEDGKTLLWSGARDGKVRLHELGAGKARLVRTWQRLGAAALALCVRRAPVPTEPRRLIVGLANGELRRSDAQQELVVSARLGSAITALAELGGEVFAGLDGEVRMLPEP